MSVDETLVSFAAVIRLIMAAKETRLITAEKETNETLASV